MSEWTPVGEKLPDHLDFFLVFCKNRNMIVAKFYPSTKQWWMMGGGRCHEISGGVTHWMLLPLTPENSY